MEASISLESLEMFMLALFGETLLYIHYSLVYARVEYFGNTVRYASEFVEHL